MACIIRGVSGLLFVVCVHVSFALEPCVYTNSYGAFNSQNPNTIRGYAWETGRNGEQDLKRAFVFYEQGVADGDPEAMYRLAVACRMADNETKFRKGFALLNRAAEMGHGPAMYLLGNFYDWGKGTSCSHNKAHHWHEKAADAGVPEAFGFLGCDYLVGEGTGRDMQKAIECFKKGMALGDGYSMYQLELLAISGRDEVGDAYKGYDQLLRALENGCFYAYEPLADHPANALAAYLRRYPGGEYEMTNGFIILTNGADIIYLNVIGKNDGSVQMQDGNGCITFPSGTVVHGVFEENRSMDHAVNEIALAMRRDNETVCMANCEAPVWCPYTVVQPDSAKAHALAFSAIFVEHNDEHHELLGNNIRSYNQSRCCRWSLHAIWKIDNRSDLLNCLTRLKNGGSQRREFDYLAARFAKVPVLFRSGEKKRLLARGFSSNRIELVEMYAEQLGEKSILAWDYLRYMMLCRWGYLAGYLNESEAWANIFSAAREMQKTFDSWEDYGRNYLIGSQFFEKKGKWSKGNISKENAYRTLIADPNGPFKRFGWNDRF